MRPIPKAMRERIAGDPFMRACVHSLIGNGGACRNALGGEVVPEWEHALEYAGRQVNERWAIVPCCWYHHRGPGLDKRLNRYVALMRATPADLAAYPRSGWATEIAYLRSVFAARLPTVERVI